MAGAARRRGAVWALSSAVLGVLAGALPAAAAANHYTFDSPRVINTPGLTLAAQTGFVDNNLGHPFPFIDANENRGLGFFCPDAGGTRRYSTKTVWYRLHPHTDGVIAIGAKSSTPGFRPHVVVFVNDSPTSERSQSCSVDPNADGNVVAPPQAVEAGDEVHAAIGAEESGATEGSFIFAAGYLADSDRDTILDATDRCPQEPGNAAAQGCAGPGPAPTPAPTPPPGPPINAPVTERISASARLSPGSYLRLRGRRYIRLGITVRRLRLAGVPAGATVDVRCTRGACRRFRKRTARKGSVTVSTLRNRKLRTGVKVRIRITKPGAIGRYFEYGIQPNDFSKRQRCLPVGSTTPRKSC